MAGRTEITDKRRRTRFRDKLLRDKLRLPGREEHVVHGLAFVSGAALLTASIYIAKPARLEPIKPDSNLSHPQPYFPGYELKPSSNVAAVLLSGIGFALLTVAVFKYFKDLVLTIEYWLLRRKRMDDFFGDGSYRHANEGLIILRRGEITDMVRDVTEEKPIRIAPHSPAARARQWVNRWDMAGIAPIREGLQKFCAKMPGFETIGGKDRKPDDTLCVAADTLGSAVPPFVINMGFGFVLHSPALLNGLVTSSGTPWIELDETKSRDSSFAFHRSLYFNRHGGIHGLEPVDDKEAQADERYKTQTALVRILPQAWDSNIWVSSKDAEEGKQQDYAIIMRRTYLVNDNPKKRQVHFILAGFTEIGTAAAGRYFSEEWETLWNDHVRGRATSAEDFGDFILVITGKSDWRARWSVAFEPITAKYISGETDFKWVHHSVTEQGKVSESTYQK